MNVPPATVEGLCSAEETELVECVRTNGGGWRVLWKTAVVVAIGRGQTIGEAVFNAGLDALKGGVDRG